MSVGLLGAAVVHPAAHPVQLFRQIIMSTILVKLPGIELGNLFILL